MTLLLSMLPIYLFGNLHCIGMCGPLVMMIGKHRFRSFYFFGRLLSFTLAGMLAGGAGAVLHLFLHTYHIPALTSFLFGGFILFAGFCALFKSQYPGQAFLAKKLAPLNQTLSVLMLKDRPITTFLFGLFTVFLPCGQTVIVFSACALSGDLYAGMLNGFVFAALTSPSLFFAMHAHSFLNPLRKHYDTILGVLAILIGTLAVCRGLSETEVIPHLVLNPKAQERYHIVLF